jgi:hypothetical protein
MFQNALLSGKYRTSSSGNGYTDICSMNDEKQSKLSSKFRSILSSFWQIERSTWRWAAGLGQKERSAPNPSREMGHSVDDQLLCLGFSGGLLTKELLK